MDNLSIQQLNIDDYQVRNLKKIFNSSEAGKKPLYIELKCKNTIDATDTLDNIAESLKELNINPFFPYPIYIITHLVNYYSRLPILNNKLELPKHFFIKDNITSSKQESILNKLEVPLKRIKNTDIEEVKKRFKEYSLRHKKLYHLTKEAYFYEELMEIPRK